MKGDVRTSSMCEETTAHDQDDHSPNEPEISTNSAIVDHGYDRVVMSIEYVDLPIDLVFLGDFRFLCASVSTKVSCCTNHKSSTLGVEISELQYDQ